MNLEIIDLPLQGLKLLQPRVFNDSRGSFVEIHHQEKFREIGIAQLFLQDNLSFSRHGVLRGLHYQYPHAQAKLVTALTGEIFDVAVDLRRDSPTFGRWHGVMLSGENHHLLFVPAGFAHGFCVTSDSAHVFYKCSDVYHPDCEHTLLWNDPDLAINWPVDKPILSEKDARGERFRKHVFPE